MSDWKFVYETWEPEKQPLREALCTLGNGYFASRGAFEWTTARPPHYPGTYLAGGYNRLKSEVAGRVIENEDFVNWPNWLYLTFRPEGGDWFDLDAVEVLHFRQELHLRTGSLEWRCRFRDPGGRETELVSRRLVHMARPHLAAISWLLLPLNWSGKIEVRSGIDGRVTNSLVARYRQLNGHHLEVVERGLSGEEGVYLVTETNQSRIRMGQAVRTRVFVGDEPLAVRRRRLDEGDLVGQVLTFDCEQDRPVRVEKVAALYTCKDRAIAEPGLEAREAVAEAGDFEDLFLSHALSWSHHWHRCEFDIRDGEETLKILRLYIFHVLQTTSINTIDLDVGVPARGLHGEAYRGHIFWDEVFVFPFLTLRIPDLTRSLLMYRYRRLPQARRAARQAGYRGAMYPWQSGSNGREESQVIHLNPKSGRWVPDNTFRQRHVNGAVAYNVWTYYQATHDMEFLSYYGAEMLVEIARFWASLATFNPERGRYEIRGVVGPDEFHTDYPGNQGQGLNNNAYTNILAAWVCHRAAHVLDLLSHDRRTKLMEDLRVSDEEVAAWEDLSRKMFIPFHDGDIISQFEGYEDLEEFDWEGYRKKYGDIQRLDRILESEGDDPNRYKVAKQADVLMLFYLFSADELREIFQRLGYPFDPASIPRNIEYYLKRTSHGSTLSRVVHSWVLARSDRRASWDLFKGALESDVSDIQGGTTQEGIHLGAMAGTIDLIQRCYIGLEVRENVLWLNPRLPQEVRMIRMRFRYRSHWLTVEVTHDRLVVTFEKGWGAPAKVGIRDRIYRFAQGETRTFDLNPT